MYNIYIYIITYIYIYIYIYYCIQASSAGEWAVGVRNAAAGIKQHAAKGAASAPRGVS